MKLIIICLSFIISSLFILQDTLAAEDNAAQIVKHAMDYLRGTSSESTISMLIKRPDWERTTEMTVWTKGDENSVFVTTAPAQDKGNGTLKRDIEMWTYNPKINRVIKLPPSMMSQSWMGSDFSNDDLVKAETIYTDYSHKVIGTEEADGLKIYLIESTPLPEAPVVWGMLKLKIREDGIFLEQKFYDEDKQLVKTLTTYEIVEFDGKLFPKKWRMTNADAPEGEYTELTYKELLFDVELQDSMFTINSLRNLAK